MELVLVDTSQIQSFIFGSNRLRENVGASFLVSHATETWPKELLANNKSDKIIYSGGGNVLLAFDDANTATNFIRALSIKIIEEAPSLQIAFARQEMTGAFHKVYQDLQLQLREKKRRGEISVPLLGLGVTRRCESTGLPANSMSREIEEDSDTSFPASNEVVEKSRMGDESTKSLHIRFEKILGKEYEFPRQLDNLGRSEGEHSHIAVVHIDGDGMGQRIQGLIADKPEFKDAKVCLKDFSDKLNTVGSTALANVLAKLVKSIDVRGENADKRGIISHMIANHEIAKIILNKNNKNGKFFLPFRPIIDGGDDLTFVCDGRLGIALAIAFMQEFERQSVALNLPGGKATACAGIAIVKVHYPFARAYSIAEELCSNAKTYKRKHKLDGAYFDWHFALSGLSGNLEAIREKEYRAQFDDRPWLHLRPYALGKNPEKTYQTWRNLEETVSAFQDPKDWLERRNKLHALEAALRQGPDHVGWFRQKYNDNKKFPTTDAALDGWQDTGWDKDRQRCGYFDALELADWYMPLANEKGGES